FFFFSSRRRHTRCYRDWSSDVCSSDLCHPHPRHRVARRAVVLADLRRSRLAMAGVWMASFGLGFRRQTRHDAVVSLRRGYTRRELNAMLTNAGVPAVAQYRPGYRIVAAWAPTDIRRRSLREY